MACMRRLSPSRGLHDIEIEKLALATSSEKIFTLLAEPTTVVAAGTNVLLIILL